MKSANRLFVVALLTFCATVALGQGRADAPPTLSEMMAALRSVADSYPPRIADEQERERALRVWKEVEVRLIDYLAGRPGDFNGELLIGDLYRMGHNLDVPEAAENAVKHLQAAIALDPANPQAHDLLGRHLTFSNRAAEGLPELLLAYALADDAGREPALFGLAHNYYLQKDFRLALAFADRFAAIRPGIGAIEQIRTSSREALKSGKAPKTIIIDQQ